MAEGTVVESQSWTVIGVYADNDQPWIEHVQASDPKQAAKAGVQRILAHQTNELMTADCVMVIEVLAGHHQGRLGNDEALSGTDILRNSA